MRSKKTSAAPSKSAASQAVEWIKAHQPILLTTHVTPDGDGLGTQAGLFYFLQSRGVKVSILNQNRLPPKFLLLDRAKVFRSVDDGHGLIETPKGVIVCDTNDWSRIGELHEVLEEKGFSARSENVFYLDHHVLHTTGLQGYMRETACATGELAYDIVEAWMKVEHESGPTKTSTPLIAASALGIYVAIVTDTGSFQFPRTTSRIHAIAGECIESGVDPYAVYQEVYGSAPFEKLLFESEVMGKARLTDCRRVIYVTVPRALRKKFNMTIEDTQGLVGRLRMVAGVDICMLAREERSGIKISLRSKGDVDVIEIAKRFQGGGHRHAAGFMLYEPLDQAVETALAAILEYLSGSKAS